MRKGDLNLSSMAGLRNGGESGDPAIAETTVDSPLWQMIDDGAMPPEDETPLTEKERALIRQWISSGAKSLTPTDLEEKQLTQHDVIPILLLRCAACHGARLKRGGVDLRTHSSILNGGDNGPAIIPGQPDDSQIIQRIESEACPPRELLLKFFVKRPPASETQRLRDWISAGAPRGEVIADVATSEPDPLVTDEDRQHWAFQPPMADVSVGSIDEFILQQLNTRGLNFSPEADRHTLIRRAWIDLTGTPPSLIELNEWTSRLDSNWYAEMIDTLLASPHYGERWGRYWLDLAGYADSEGGVSADPVRAVAWKYRDYVIQSFNNDKPYDQFLTEQIAGDELQDYENVDAITQEIVDNLTATGFLRMGIDQTGSRTMNFVPERLGVIGDAITVVSSGLMGLTMECAKCHTHKYDAIPHRDYYRFKAIFQGALDEHNWLSFKTRTLNTATTEHRKRVAAVNPPLAAELKQREADLKKTIASLQTEMLRQHYPRQSDTDRQETLRALRIADNNRTQPQRRLVEMLQQVEALPNEKQPPPVIAAQQAVTQIKHDILNIKRQMEPPIKIRALWDRGNPSPTYILRRGEHDKPGRLVGPGVPSVMTDGKTPFRVKPPFLTGTAKTGRRLAFANWLTASKHPTTSRVMVNRLWYHHFGTGLVKTLENFGVKGDRPSHPELLDWLAVRFIHDGWSIKDIHRLVMNSRTYRQSSRITDKHLQHDPQNRLLSRMPLRRMDAEALRDSLLSVSGCLDKTQGGPPDSVSVNRDGLVSVHPTASNQWRRSVYLQYRRTEIPSLMDTFDYPEMGPNCLTRSVSTVSPQSLMLMNNRHVRDLAGAFAERVRRLAPANMVQQIQLIYQLALSRRPNEREQQAGVNALKGLTSLSPNDPGRPLETYCHTILNTAAFLYVD